VIAHSVRQFIHRGIQIAALELSAKLEYGGRQVGFGRGEGSLECFPSNILPAQLCLADRPHDGSARSQDRVENQTFKQVGGCGSIPILNGRERKRELFEG